MARWMAAAAERDALAARLGEAEGLLREVEWADSDDPRVGLHCPECWAERPGPRNDSRGHATGCRLAAFLAAGAKGGGTR